MSDRTVTLGGEKEFSLSGTPVTVGEKARDVTLVDSAGSSVRMLASTGGKVRLISVVPNIETSICDLQTRRMNEEAAKLGDNVVILTVSSDLPAVQANWCAAAGVDQVIMLSDHQNLAFGEAYGTKIDDLDREQRSMFVVDADGVVRYVEYVPEIGQHPDYDAALAALNELV